MKPIVKWQGGKRRELDHIRPYIPSNVSNISEPFCGGAAVAFDREGIAFLNDTNRHLINLYQQLAKPEGFAAIMQKVDWLKDHPEHLEREYYHARQIINSPSCTFIEDATAFLIVQAAMFQWHGTVQQAW